MECIIIKAKGKVKYSYLIYQLGLKSTVQGLKK